MCRSPPCPEKAWVFGRVFAFSRLVLSFSERANDLQTQRPKPAAADIGTQSGVWAELEAELEVAVGSW